MIRNLLTYWRNSLADEDLMAPNDPDVTMFFSAADLSEDGVIPAIIASRLREQWCSISTAANDENARFRLDASEDFGIVPVLLLTHGLAGKRQHGAVVGNPHTEVTFTLLVPALLDGSGALSPDPAHQPWIGRDYLEPTFQSGKEIPIIGEIVDFDHWMEQHSTTDMNWLDLMHWCEGLWEAVTHNELPEGYVLIDDLCVRVSQAKTGMSASILRLYDALLAEDRLPALLKTVCQNDRSISIGRMDRLAQMDAPRGMMTSSYGLTCSQTMSVVALTKLPVGNLLAVNGPPGTGKTTLLQAIVATETVRRALEGGGPAIIIGCSTNNQAVTNINRAMNEAISENKYSSPWSRRWLPEVESYGLYLPAASRVEEAIHNGFSYAFWASDERAWTGLPEKEVDSEYVAQACDSWLAGFEATYGSRPTGLHEGIEHVRADLRALQAEVVRVKAALTAWSENEDWWTEVCGGNKEPEDYIESARLENTVRLSSAQAEVNVVHSNIGAASERWMAVKSSLELQLSYVRTQLTDADAQLDISRSLKSRILAAGAAKGFVEVAAEVFPPFQQTAFNRQQPRMIAELHNDQRQFYRNVLDARSRSAWYQQADVVVTSFKMACDALGQSEHELVRRMAAAEAAFSSEVSELDRALGTARQNVEKIQNDGAKQLCFLRKRLDLLYATRRAASDMCQNFHIGGQRPVPVAATADRADYLVLADQALDMSIRFEMFQKAMRYWEGRWLIAAQLLCADPSSNRKRGRRAVVMRLQRWCMLTPCIVSTLHNLVRHMIISSFVETASDENKFKSAYLLDGIDLLIMDESGQVAPHVGMASFALAKRAVIVGDIHQIEPVIRVRTETDCANAARAGLSHLWQEGKPTSGHFLSEAANGVQGSVMRVAQLATCFTSPHTERERGIVLSEHFRCDPAIIRFCNELVYGGRLKPVSGPRVKPPGMRAWGWAHVRGTCLKRGGSRMNNREAKAIAEWIQMRATGADGWLSHYRNLDPEKYTDLGKIVAVITPFRAQAEGIRKALKEAIPTSASLVVGTVHSLQGADAPIVIFSPTYSADAGQTLSKVFDRKPNMMNVAVSRARDSFIVLGDMRLFRAERPGSQPSSMMAKYLFSDADNEITDVGGNYGFPDEIRVIGERISTLERHRAVLTGSLRTIQAGEALFIVSPWIALRPILADKVTDLCREAISRGARVHVVVDRDWTRDDTNKQSNEALALLSKAGATVHLIRAIHNKTIVVADREIIEGSFNWLSAVRDTNLRGVRHETSWRISGRHAAPVITKAVEELVLLGVQT